MPTRKLLIEALRSTDEPELQGAIKNAIDIAEEDYMRSNGFRSKYISPKERKANQVKWTYKYGDKEIKHLTSKQLGAIIRKPRIN